MIKHLLLGVTTVQRDPQWQVRARPVNLQGKLPKASATLIAQSPGHHLCASQVFISTHSSMVTSGFTFLPVKWESRSRCLQVESLGLRSTLSPTFIISEAVLRECSRVCLPIVNLAFHAAGQLCKE